MIDNKLELYKNPATEQQPVCLFYMLDMSGSMAEEVTFNGESMSKSAVVARNVNLCLNDLIYRCRRGEVYKDYAQVMVLGYNGKGVTSLLDKYATTGQFATINDLADANADVHTYTSTFEVEGTSLRNELKIKALVNIEPFDNTPMYSCFEETLRRLQDWYIGAGRDSFPAMVINVTDGEYTDASDSDMIAITEKVRNTGNINGNTLLFNIHITNNSETMPINFPSSAKQIDNIKFARQLFDMSSPIPTALSHEFSLIAGRKECGAMRGMAYNISASALLEILQIGSISVINR